MASLNEFHIIGNITKDVTLETMPNGKVKCIYTVAINDSYLDRDGKQQKTVSFIPVTRFGKPAQADAKYLKKGSLVRVKGAIRSWYDRDTNKGGFNFEAEDVQYLSKAPLSPEEDAWQKEYERAEREQTGQQ